MTKNQTLRLVVLPTMALLLAAASSFAQGSSGGSESVPANLTLPAPVSSLTPEALLDPSSSAWQGIAARRVALNRTPPLYDTDAPAGLEISIVEVKLLRAGDKLLVLMNWRDPSENSAALAAAPDSPAETRNLKAHTEETSRFFDAAAVMVPVATDGAVYSPSLQMGDPGNVVNIYYWNATRGAMRMTGHGRGTTSRTGNDFPARAAYRNGSWSVVMELAGVPAGTQLAFAVWNGSQQDRDGRKYFSIWHWLG